jgi:type VI secretion system secreted protein Hcp
MADIFAKLAEIEGESADDRHRGEIDVLSFSLGIATAAGGASSGGAAAGKPSFQDVVFVHRIDKATPALMRACATGKHLPEAVISQRKAGRGQQDYFVVKLSDVAVSAVAAAGAADPPGTETVSLSFARIQVEYRPQRPDGSLDVPVVFKYDVRTNREG